MCVSIKICKKAGFNFIGGVENTCARVEDIFLAFSMRVQVLFNRSDLLLNVERSVSCRHYKKALLCIFYTTVVRRTAVYSAIILIIRRRLVLVKILSRLNDTRLDLCTSWNCASRYAAATRQTAILLDLIRRTRLPAAARRPTVVNKI